MVKKFLKRFTPDPKTIKNHKYLRLFGSYLHDYNLWHFNRYSVAWAFSIGLFCAFIPLPLQMVIAAGCSIVIRANLPTSVLLVWITNPITMPAIFYFAYKVGTTILAVPPRALNFEISVDWLVTQLGQIWQPFLLGCLICGIVFAILGQITIRCLWRMMVVKAWRKRQRLRNKKL